MTKKSLKDKKAKSNKSKKGKQGDKHMSNSKTVRKATDKKLKRIESHITGTKTQNLETKEEENPAIALYNDMEDVKMSSKNSKMLYSLMVEDDDDENGDEPVILKEIIETKMETLSIEIRHEPLVKKIMDYGFNRNLIIRHLNLMKFDEKSTVLSICQAMFKVEVQELEVPKDDLAQLREDEFIVLESMFDPENISIGANKVDIEIKDKQGTLTIHVEVPSGSLYPFEAPIVMFQGNALTQFAKEKLMNAVFAEISSLYGSPMIYTIYQYVLDHKDKIREATHIRHESITISIQEEDDIDFESGFTEEELDNPWNLKAKELEKKDWTKDIKLSSKNDGKVLQKEFLDKLKNEQYLDMQKRRQNLPIWAKRKEIIDAINDNQVVCIEGQTGSGKSTQLCQFIYNHLAEQGKDVGIMCTQPRRISAISIAERVAVEQGEKIGNRIGYSIRLESSQSKDTKVLFCTTGVLLRRLESDSLLHGISHIIIDEVHERSIDSDFLLLILKTTLKKRRDLKVILMSASMNAEIFSKYFANCPLIEIKGRTFPVQEYFLEDALEMTKYKPEGNYMLRNEDLNKKAKTTSFADHEKIFGHLSKGTVETLWRMDEIKIQLPLIVELLKWIVKKDSENGAALIFLPGMQEILSLMKDIQKEKVFKNFKIIPLHSTLPSVDQQSVFEKAKDGMRKVILATNIAETSITIDDVTWVIDTGKMKEMQYDSERGIASLVETFIAKSNAKQRCGRAGRTKKGTCFHLFTRHRHTNLLEQQIPEIKRTPLEQICLRIKFLQIGEITDVLSKAIEPPAPKSIQHSIKILKQLNAFDSEKGDLTDLGYHLAQIPIDVRLGKMILFAVLFKCLDPILTIASSLGFQSPFMTPFNQKEDAIKARKEYGDVSSDHLTILKAYNAWLEAKAKKTEKEFCNRNFLSIPTLKMIHETKQQFLEVLSSLGFVKEHVSVKQGVEFLEQDISDVFNANSKNDALIKAILCAGLYPNIVYWNSKENKWYSFKNGQVNVHPTSIVSIGSDFKHNYFVYHEKVKTHKIFIRDLTMVSPYAMMLFCRNWEMEEDGVVTVDGWIKYKMRSGLCEMLREVRASFVYKFAEKLDEMSFNKEDDLINGLITLITTEK